MQRQCAQLRGIDVISNPAAVFHTVELFQVRNDVPRKRALLHRKTLLVEPRNDFRARYGLTFRLFLNQFQDFSFRLGEWGRGVSWRAKLIEYWADFGQIRAQYGLIHRKVRSRRVVNPLDSLFRYNNLRTR